MVRSIIVVAVLLLGLTYSAFFLMWNSEMKVNLVTLAIGGPPFWIGGVPVGFLPIVGAIIGAVVMAVAAWMPWAGQRAANKALEAKLQKAIDRFNEQKGVLKARNERIAQLEDDLSRLEGAAVASPEAAVAPPSAGVAEVNGGSTLAMDVEPAVSFDEGLQSEDEAL